jgi:predicted ATPase/class 3 adenylate cyclase
VKYLIPHFIQEQFEAKVFHGKMDAFTVFVDLSGFTPLTDKLMQEGPTGAERLSIILNDIFGPLVGLVYQRGGFIPYFAGDAFTAIFPISDGIKAKDILEAAIQMHQLFDNRDTLLGEFKIGIKSGISFGEVEWGIVGRHNKSFYFRGAAMYDSAESQVRAEDGDIVVDQFFLDQYPGQSFEWETVDQKYFKLQSIPTVPFFQAERQDFPSISYEAAQHFLPNAVIDYDQEGEFRSVLTIFISFDGVDSHEQLNEFATVVLDEINNFSGYFKEIDFGDKGGLMVGLFGAPVTYENSVERAMEFILALRENLAEQEQRGLKYKIGATVGTAYTGVIGGKNRCQYAAVGNRVNLAARIMSQARWGEVLVDLEIQKDQHFRFLNKGEIRYKGIQGTVPTYKLLGRNYDTQTSYYGKMVGRSTELEQLLELAQPIFKSENAGIVYVFGEAGVGKSRLAHELRKLLVGENLAQWHIAQTDQILKKPFNPFIYFLRNYFEVSPDGSSDMNLENFHVQFNKLGKELQKIDTKDANNALKELNRTKSVLAALIGINLEGSIWNLLDAKGRYQNTLAAIINLVLAESLVQPIIFELEDAHWLDENSSELMHELIRQLKRFPILFLITSRFKDDGSKPLILRKDVVQSTGLNLTEIDLNTLNGEAVRNFAETILKGKISDGFFNLLVRTSNSNPFYLEQVLEYFVERNLVHKEDGVWSIQEESFKISSSINAILTARIDRLSTLVKETVKSAAVIGREFELPILTEVMKAQPVFLQKNGSATSLLKEQVKSAERVQIWHAMNELRYIFRHALLREAVYSMQLRTRLQQLHRLIAEAIEKIFSEKLEERYVDLAFHYEQAEVFDKTCEYLRKAADYFKSNYQNQQALDYYEKLLEKLNYQDDIVHQLQTHLKKGKVLELIGHWESCQTEYERALALAKETRDALLLGRANNELGHLLVLKGDYTEAKQYLNSAVQMFESIEDQLGMARVNGNLGDFYFRQGQYEQAKSYLEKSIQIGYEINESAVSAKVVSTLGLTYMNQGKYEEGISCQLVQLEVSERNNDKQGMAKLYTDLGIIYFEKGDYDDALESYQKGLKLAEELGNKQQKAIAIGCIGNVYVRKGNYPSAMEHFELDLELVEELGDKQGTAIALGLIGELLSIKGDFHRAIEYLQKNLMLSEELGYQKGIALAVNTLADVFFYTEQYDRALHYYDRAIDVTRRIDNKLVLGSSLVEKGFVLIEMNRMAELQVVCTEALALAKELGNPDLLFSARLLHAYANAKMGEEEKANQLLNELLEGDINKEQEADVFHQLSMLHPNKDDYRQKALNLYQELFSETPKHNYKVRISNLSVD